MQLPLRIKDRTGQTLQLQIFEQIRRLILDGRLRPGACMPASRVLAADLRVSRNTVVLAYERLEAEGYLAIRQPTGTFVSRNVIFDSPSLPVAPVTDDQDAAAMRRRARLVFRGESHIVVSPYDKPVPYDFWVGRPDARLFPARLWQNVNNRKLHQMRDGISGYSDPAGLWALRQAVADYVGVARGIKAATNQVLIINGIQEGLNILARLFVRRGTEVAIENPCYRGAANVFASHGARLIPVPVDGHGANVARLPRDAAFIYLTPSHQYPTGVTLSLERRARLLEWAEQLCVYVVEDDYDSDFYYDSAPLPALHSLDTHDQVIYLGTFSKSLAAGLRIGYMIVPRHLAAVATTVKALLNNCSSWLPQALLAEFISSGAFMHHLRRIRTIYCARRNRLLEALNAHFGAVEIRGAQGGMHLVWYLPKEFPAAFQLERRCRRDGVGVYSVKTGNALVVGAAEARHARTVMLGYAALDETEITEGVRRLAGALEAERPKRTAIRRADATQAASVRAPDS